MNTKSFIIRLPLMLMGVMLFNSCELEDANVNPNRPTEVPPSVMLPYNQERLARLNIGTTQVMTGIFMQYYEGVDNHPVQVQQYILNEALYVDWNWNDYYDGPMVNLKVMIELAEKEGSFYYAGIGKVLLANCLGNVTSLYGDVPFKEALKGSTNRNPVYDSQKEIYEAIQQLLDESIQLLETEYAGKKPASDDIMFGGDAGKWIKAAWALKARYYMHLSKKSGELDYNPAEKALEATANAMTSADGDLMFQYGYSASEYNPFYSYTLLNYILPHPNFTNLLLLTNDPRKNFYYKKKFGESTLNGLYFTSTASPSLLMTYHEVKFIEAEARIRINPGDPAAQIALNEAVRANIDKITGGTTSNETILSFQEAYCVLNGNFDQDLRTIIKQKYIALFCNIESWTDYRRTGFPELTPNTGGDHNQNPGGAIPRRFAYPQTERLFNNNFPATLPTLQDRFWWDM
jgi:hypothetical protein